MLKLALLLALGALAAAQPTPPPTAAAPAKKVKHLIDLQPADVDARRLLVAPPADGTAPAVADLAALHAALQAASPERQARARWDDAHEDPTLFAPTLGPAFDLARLPATAALLEVVQADADFAASAAKKVFQRKRPWAVDATVRTCDPDDKPLTSYPSGHATLGWSLAMTLSLAMPERANALMSRAADYAASRVVCGSHYASDVQASQVLAAAMVNALRTDADFAARLQAARAELVAHGLAHAG